MNNPSSSSSSPPPPPPQSTMDLPPLTTATASFDWSDLLDFSLDDSSDPLLLLSLDDDPLSSPPPPPPPSIPVPSPQPSDRRVRKRDPRLVCENYLAGRVPCACPEVDEMMMMMREEEEEVEGEGGGGGERGKKKARRGAGSRRERGVARCQVPECGVDIGGLKGYHRRHRVCLGCANAVMVMIGCEEKRYCQQCGKFHVLSDFDEGKRSCRRKLERHNNRRRKSMSRGATQTEAQGDLLFEDVSSDGEAGRVNICSTSQIAEDDERELSLDHKNENVSNLCSVMDSQNMQRDSVASFTASQETLTDKGKDDSAYDLSPSYCNNKSAYSSMCPTGRISFKLYDWNPAEFPRRLRHQIFQWLASMPVELEGYIRPGCTILTAFISMPQFAWTKLFEDPASCLRDFLKPGGMLCGRGTAFVYLNNCIFGVLRDGTSVVKVEVAVRAPKLHYVYPPCFEAGRPMEFVACGSNLLQSKFRSLVSFSGKYLAHDYSVIFPHEKDKIDASLSFNNQQLRINVPYTEPECFGPGFIEVENGSGLSNFIPILIADKKICSEVMMIYQKYGVPLFANKTQWEADNPLCMRQTEFSDLILDVAWLLKEPPLEKTRHALTSVQLQRFNYLLNFLISNESVSMLERIVQRLTNLMDGNAFTGVIDVGHGADILLFQKHISQARGLVSQKLKVDEHVLQKPQDLVANSADAGVLSISSVYCQDMEMEVQHHVYCKETLHEHSNPQRKDETTLLLKGEVSSKLLNTRTRESCNPMVAKKIITYRSLVYLFAIVAICCGVCAVLLHPYAGGSLAVTIRRCLFDGSF